MVTDSASWRLGGAERRFSGSARCQYDTVGTQLIDQPGRISRAVYLTLHPKLLRPGFPAVLGEQDV